MMDDFQLSLLIIFQLSSSTLDKYWMIIFFLQICKFSIIQIYILKNIIFNGDLDSDNKRN